MTDFYEHLNFKKKTELLEKAQRQTKQSQEILNLYLNSLPAFENNRYLSPYAKVATEYFIPCQSVIHILSNLGKILRIPETTEEETAHNDRMLSLGIHTTTLGGRFCLDNLKCLKLAKQAHDEQSDTLAEQAAYQLRLSYQSLARGLIKAVRMMINYAEPNKPLYRRYTHTLVTMDALNTLHPPMASREPSTLNQCIKSTVALLPNLVSREDFFDLVPEDQRANIMERSRELLVSSGTKMMKGIHTCQANNHDGYLTPFLDSLDEVPVAFNLSDYICACLTQDGYIVHKGTDKKYITDKATWILRNAQIAHHQTIETLATEAAKTAAARRLNPLLNSQKKFDPIPLLTWRVKESWREWTAGYIQANEIALSIIHPSEPRRAQLIQSHNLAKKLNTTPRPFTPKRKPGNQPSPT